MINPKIPKRTLKNILTRFKWASKGRPELGLAAPILWKERGLYIFVPYTITSASRAILDFFKSPIYYVPVNNPRFFGFLQPAERQELKEYLAAHLSLKLKPWRFSGDIYRYRAAYVLATGATLTRNIDIHHKDGNSLNDRLSNLQAMTKSEHANHHKDYHAQFSVPAIDIFRAMDLFDDPMCSSLQAAAPQTYSLISSIKHIHQALGGVPDDLMFRFIRHMHFELQQAGIDIVQFYYLAKMPTHSAVCAREWIACCLAGDDPATLAMWFEPPEVLDLDGPIGPTVFDRAAPRNPPPEPFKLSSIFLEPVPLCLDWVYQCM